MNSGKYISINLHKNIPCSRMDVKISQLGVNTK